ncbi:adenylyltransferase/cytidyltransferase family protein [Pectobacterium parvum]|uniref:adenylyltransferase/cytidyltransferase family protein n=1 Tax=Pectobacterium TaxID=122277 RepID=UPI000CD08AEB|nr:MULTISPECIES: adenylyltransferase/cytidyltransferase family protein [Pectobacterium]POE06268.1 glycerol-3-phosphate cytidylyltransferase [Pectobacterium odoriferum]UFK41094.1 adenylyltransferase/cytidyltransferase family protein [Pectobacterium parvum]GKW44179.1 glycerol-3-phosphate cytidylyltransferase [Pectobacterium carotovorum subsp. carotovorum]
MKTVITFGTFDLFHVGHLNIIERASKLGGRLVVGVSADELNIVKGKELPAIPQNERLAIIKALYCVDEVFLEESLELKSEYIVNYKADLLVMGDDWRGRFDDCSQVCEVIYLPRTPGISSTLIKAKLSNIL